MSFRALCIFAAGLLAACASSPPDTFEVQEFGDLLDSERFGPRPEIVSPSDIHRLSPEQEHAFLAYLRKPSPPDTRKHERVADYLRTITNNFNYYGETYTASEALARNSGNCLSLAVVTTAMADLAGVNIEYQLVDSAPVFEWRGSIVYKGLHVRSVLYDPDWMPSEAMFTIRRPSIRIDYFPNDSDRFVGNLQRQGYIALFYNNLAADAIGDRDYSLAYWLLRESMELAPENANTLNMMAVLHRRIGDEQTAETLYQHGIAHFPNKVSFLRNYQVLLRKQERQEEANKVGRTLAKLDEPNPIEWLQAAEAAYGEGDHRDAISFYRKAVKVAPYLHEAYLGMAKAYYELGNMSSAKRQLKRALEHAKLESTKSLYQAKLMALEASR